MAKNFLKSSSIKNIDTAFLKNRALLYVILLLSLANVYYMMLENNITFLMVFIIIGFLTSFFSKNMVVILSVAMAFTHILKYGANVYKLEGYENGESETEEKEEEPEEETEEETEGFEDNEEEEGELTEGIRSMDSSGNRVSSVSSVVSKNENTPVPSNTFDLKYLMPTIQDNTEIQKKILEKLSGIEKFTNGLNEFMN
jgi:hypothetical protein